MNTYFVRTPDMHDFIEADYFKFLNDGYGENAYFYVSVPATCNEPRTESLVAYASRPVLVRLAQPQDFPQVTEIPKSYEPWPLLPDLDFSSKAA